jgi:hypothetical protein
MSGCGGKMMSKGGKVSPVKKMQNGGALKPLGAKIGVGTNIAGALGMGIKAISDAVKAKKEKKKALTEKNTESVTETKKRGGAKYQKGGIAKQTIVGMPGYNARTDTMKKGGSAKKYAKGGSTFGMLSVKAGIDKNPKPTAADRIAGAKKKKK